MCGSRSWNRPSLIGKRLSKLPPGSTIVHGKSPGGGADELADAYGRALGHDMIPVPINDTDRRRAGKTRRAPILRNLRMLDEHPDIEVVLAFWDGESPGTRHMIDEAENRGIRVEILYEEGGTDWR